MIFELTNFCSVSFFVSGFFVFKEDRATKVSGGGASYA